MSYIRGIQLYIISTFMACKSLALIRLDIRLYFFCSLSHLRKKSNVRNIYIHCDISSNEFIT